MRDDPWKVLEDLFTSDNRLFRKEVFPPRRHHDVTLPLVESSSGCGVTAILPPPTHYGYCLPTPPSSLRFPNLLPSHTMAALAPTSLGQPAPVSAAYIPNDKPPRTLVLCFDGTGDQFDADNSNVIQFFTLLKKDDKHEQMVYYQAGIGTYTSPQIATPIMAKISRTMDEAIAWNLNAHVMGGYEFLMQNYEAGDKICIFGFSRGAYTARALAGMIHKVGLLPACNMQQVPFAYKMFQRTDETGWAQSTAFKKAFSIDVDIEFLGVWDTVCSVGLIPRTLPFTASNESIKTFRHAVSLDEHRAKFKANLFNRPTKEEEDLGTHPGDMPKSTGEGADAVTSPFADFVSKAANGGTSKSAKKKTKDERTMEREFSEGDKCNHETDVLEVWFAGCHCDIGGGSVSNDTPHNLARIPLRWMIRQCFLAKTGIRFHSDLIPGVGLDPNALWPVVSPRPKALDNAAISSIPEIPSGPPGGSTVKGHDRGSTSGTLVNYADVPPAGSVLTLTEEQEDLLDLRCDVYDQLALAPWWWILELLPLRHKAQKDDNYWATYYAFNLGQGRKVPKHHQHPGIHIHRTVKTRMEASDLKQGPYVPRANFDHQKIIWED
ncbi:hypothetical protein EIP91_006271 [Steccherinum ochraceum]|uniref:T6SS Phospholipase effector Tle1-like catalytic domain-containing protein n=1 Tax=Steccherinum ochraceum TaxID=92696 RepID=A0A4R0RBS3_9APHY|nr:hypothetical protein EIP91_006271 [Steccherinum ochraceum]